MALTKIPRPELAIKGLNKKLSITFNALTDVNLTTATDAQVLVYSVAVCSYKEII